MGINPTPRKGIIDKIEEQSLIRPKKDGLLEVDMLIASWNVKLLLRNGSRIMLTEQLIVYNLQITATKENRLQGKQIAGTTTYNLFQSNTHQHNTLTYYYFLGTYSVFVCIGLLIIEQNNGTMLPKHTFMYSGKAEGKQECGMSFIVTVERTILLFPNP